MDGDEKQEVKTDEEQEVRDNDADTRDVLNEQRDDYADFSKRLTKMEDAINRMSGIVEAVQKAQTSMVDMGAVIREGNPTDDASSDEDSFVPIEELDFSL